MKEAMFNRAEFDDAMNDLEIIHEGFARVIFGQSQLIDRVLITLLTNNHCLIEGVPGLAKTLLIKTLSDAMDLSFNRIGDQGAVALANSPYLNKLEVLCLDANRIGYKGMKAFAESKSLKNLKELHLMYNLIDPAGLELMRFSEKLNSLQLFKCDE